MTKSHEQEMNDLINDRKEQMYDKLSKSGKEVGREDFKAAHSELSNTVIEDMTEKMMRVVAKDGEMVAEALQDTVSGLTYTHMVGIKALRMHFTNCLILAKHVEVTEESLNAYYIDWIAAIIAGVEPKMRYDLVGFRKQLLEQVKKVEEREAAEREKENEQQDSQLRSGFSQ